MTRRLRWLVIGAVIGITGYRRLTRAGLALLPARFRAMPAFLRDVRSGMAEYEQQYQAQLARRPEPGRDNRKAGR